MTRQTLFTLLTVAYIGTIYASSGFARSVTTFMRHMAGGHLNLMMTAFLAALIILFILFRHATISRERFLPLALVLAGYGLAIAYLQVPEERLHLLQYGLPCYLCSQALPARLGNTNRSLLVIFLITLAGIGDELIQALRPNRVGDLRDILINGYAAALAQSLLMILSHRVPPAGSGR